MLICIISNICQYYYTWIEYNTSITRFVIFRKVRIGIVREICHFFLYRAFSRRYARYVHMVGMEGNYLLWNSGTTTTPGHTHLWWLANNWLNLVGKFWCTHRIARTLHRLTIICFGLCKTCLMEKKLANKRAAENHVAKFFATKPQNFYTDVIMKLPEKWQKVKDNNGTYVLI